MEPNPVYWVFVKNGMLRMAYLHPGKLTWNLKITCLKRRIIFKTAILGFHVNFQGCIHKFPLVLVRSYVNPLKKTIYAASNILRHPEMGRSTSN